MRTLSTTRPRPVQLSPLSLTLRFQTLGCLWGRRSSPRRTSSPGSVISGAEVTCRRFKREIGWVIIVPGASL
ncbi:hypothetical protein GN956_G1664 [Arapaima gigas]